MCLCVCLCLNAGLTAALINLIFGLHTHIRRDCAIGYMISNFDVFIDHFRSNKLSQQDFIVFGFGIVEKIKCACTVELPLLPKGYSQKFQHKGIFLF